jgi:hypothetical protein
VKIHTVSPTPGLLASLVSKSEYKSAIATAADNELDSHESDTFAPYLPSVSKEVGRSFKEEIKKLKKECVAGTLSLLIVLQRRFDHHNIFLQLACKRCSKTKQKMRWQCGRK